MRRVAQRIAHHIFYRFAINYISIRYEVNRADIVLSGARGSTDRRGSEATVVECNGHYLFQKGAVRLEVAYRGVIWETDLAAAITRGAKRSSASFGVNLALEAAIFSAAIARPRLSLIAAATDRSP